jgi:RNA polymerase sigma factor (sigma-70 family)
MTAIPSASELVSAAAAGDARAWDRLCRRYGRLVDSMARRHRLNEADAGEAAQTTWMRAVENIHGLKAPERVGAWLATIARRECLRILRGAARQLPTDDVLARHADDSAPVDAELLARERRSVVRRALATLPPRQRTLLRLLYREPAPSYEAIGSALGMPIGSIGPMRGRALDRMREHVERAELAAAA